MNKTFNIYKPTFMEKGNCVGLPTRWWFPEFGDKREQIKNTQKAKALCLKCEVKEQCISYAKETRSSGIWGAMSFDRGMPNKRGKRNVK
jgi:hypothetical protein